MKERVLIFDMDYLLEGTKPIIRLFCLNEKGEKLIAYDQNFFHYFYALPKKGKIDTLIEKIKSIDEKKVGTKILEVKKERRILGKEKVDVIKICIENPRKISRVRDEIKDWEEVEETYGYNINFYRRYLIDKNLKPMGFVEIEGEIDKSKSLVYPVIKLKSIKSLEEEKEIKPKIIAFDTEWIERDGKHELIMLSLVGNNGLKKVITSQDWEDKPEWVESVANERKIIERFNEILKEEDPVFLVGYNSDDFDFSKLKEKMSELKLDLRIGKLGEKLKFVRRGRTSSARLKGVVHIDLFVFINNILSASLKSEVLTLDEVAQELIGEKKKEMEYKEMVEIWKSKKKQLTRLAEYNLHDSVLALKLSELLLPQIFALSRLIGEIPFDCSRESYSQLVEQFFMRKAFLENRIIPNSPKTEEKERRRMYLPYKGAIVIEPKKGIHSDILVYDFRSLPSWEKIYVKDPEGFVRVVEIGKFVDGFLKKNKVFREGESLIAKIEGWEALTFDEKENKVCWKPIKAVIKHKNSFPYILQITTEQGKRVAVTPNHSIFSLDENGKLVLLRGDELKVGTNLILPKRIPISEKMKELDVWKIFSSLPSNQIKDLLVIVPRNILPYKKRLKTWLNILKKLRSISSLIRLKKSLDYHEKTILHNLNLLEKEKFIEIHKKKVILLKEGKNFLQFILSLKPARRHGYLQTYFEKVKNLQIPRKIKEHSYFKQRNGRWKRKLPCILKLDENISWGFGLFVAEGWISKYRIYFSTSSSSIKKKLLKIFSYFEPKCYWYKNKNEFEISIYNKPLALLLSRLFGSSSYQKKIDPLLLHLLRNLKIKIVEGMIDGDGSLGEKNFKYTSVSGRLINDLNLLLLSLGIGRTSFIHSKKIKNLYVYQSIGKIKVNKSKRESHPLYLIPRKYVERYISPHLKNKHRGPRISSEKVMVNLIGDGGLPSQIDFFFGDCGLERIKKIEKIVYRGWVYDISVKDTEKFFAGDGLILVHNSLYPTIIVTHNISPETLNCEHKECKEKNKVPGLKYHFCIKEEGFIPKYLKQLIELRKKIKSEMKKIKKSSPRYRLLDNRQYSLKIIANATYGYFAFIGARWYSRECAQAAAAFGRYYITKSVEMLKKENCEIIYGDTDSVFFRIPNVSGNALLKRSEEILEKINKEFPGIIELEFRGLYQAGIFVTREKGEVGAKKRYALLDQEGNLEIRGFEVVRRDWCQLAKDIQRKVLTLVLKERNPQKAVELVRETIKKLKERKVRLDDLVIYEQITRPLNEYEQLGPHVKAAKKAKERGIPIIEGSIIGYIIRKGSGSISDRAEPAEFVSINDYDINYYIHHQILPASMRVFKALGITEEQVLSGRIQKGLHEFFKRR